MADYLFVYGTLRQHAPRRAAGNRCYQLLQQHASLLGQVKRLGLSLARAA